MIYHLFEYLRQYDIPGQGLFTYLSFRAMLTSITAMLLSFFAGRKIIKWLQRKQIGETIRDLGLEGQMQKKGTPTMGGVIIILAIVVPVLLFCNLRNIYIQLLLLTTVWCGALGFADDYIKVFKHNKEGLHPKAKLVCQLALGLVIGLAVCFSDDIVIREKVPVVAGKANVVEQGNPGALNVDTETLVAEDSGWEMENVIKSTKTTIPFVKDHEFDYKWFSPFKGRWGWYCKWAVYVLMIVFVIMACSNGTNLTDGMDGLAAGTSATVGVVLGILAWLGGNLVNSDYLNIMYIPGSGEIAIFMSAFVGALMGFLWYNSYPAQVFMGDTGSLTIGGIIGVSAVLMRKELLLPILCGIFLVESLSVIMQRVYFKYTKKKYGEGRRIFKMTPLHHHYQKEGIPALISRPVHAIPEAKIVTRFWLIGVILAVSTLALLKIRKKIEDMSRIVVLGGGESGVGAAVLAKVKGFDVFLSDNGKIPEHFAEDLRKWDISFEEGHHTEELILNADEVIKSPGIPSSVPIVRKLEAQGTHIISEIEFAGRYDTAKKICITGSNGKTTTTSLIYYLLQNAGLNVGLGGNIGKSYALQVATEHFDYYVLEISSFQLDNCYDFRPDIAIITNITPDHLDRYDYQMENYVKAKFRLTQNLRPEDCFIFDSDDEITIEHLNKIILSAKRLPFTQKDEVKQGAFLKGDKIVVKYGEEECDIFLKELALGGKHNIYNSMAAALAAKASGIDNKTIREALATFQPIEHRLEPVLSIKDVLYINDSKATNVDAAWYALECQRKPIVWIVGGTDKLSLIHI